ncbi:MAG: tRNA (guanosine(37)-N1)-methyltransferase TrmD [Acidobacteriota bacterium]
MKIKVLTLFPELFESPLKASLMGKALDKGAMSVDVVNIRDYALDKHFQADDYPFGGGAGMVMKADVVLRAIQSAKTDMPGMKVVYLSPAGKQLTQDMVRVLAQEEGLCLLCGHYEGIDERSLSAVDEVVSIGDYVLTGGELPALVVIDAISRMIPGVLGCQESTEEESFSEGLLEYPQYTRPREVEDMEVPPVLLSGNHEQIRRWRKKESLRKTLLIRPDMLIGRRLDKEEKTLILEILNEGEGSESQ